MKTWGRRVHLVEGTGSAKALRLDWSVLCLLWEKQQEELDGQAEMGEGRRSRDWGWHLSHFNILLSYWVMSKPWGAHIIPGWKGAASPPYYASSPAATLAAADMPTWFRFPVGTVGFWCPTTCLAHQDSLICGNLWEAICLSRQVSCRIFPAMYCAKKEGSGWDSANTFLSSPWHLHEGMKGNAGEWMQGLIWFVWGLKLIPFWVTLFEKKKKTYEYTFRCECKCLFKMRRENENKSQILKS